MSIQCEKRIGLDPLFMTLIVHAQNATLTVAEAVRHTFANILMLSTDVGTACASNVVYLKSETKCYDRAYLIELF